MMQKKPRRRPATPAGPTKQAEETRNPITGKTADSWVVRMIMDAARQHADAVHIENGGSGMTVKFRVDGMLKPYTGPETGEQDDVVSRLKKMARMKAEDARIPQDGRFGAIVDSREIDFRVHSLTTPRGESMVLRVLDRATLITLAKLGLQPAALTRARALLKRPGGLVLVAGPAGSGKTTTLYAMLSELAKGDKKVVTIEDPIEFELDNVTQSQVEPRSGYNYATALSLVARQDPDVVMVSELGEVDTARAALQTALGGRLVLSSIHANDAAEAIARLLGMGVDPVLLAAGVECVLSQRVLRRVCPACRHGVAPTKSEKGMMGLKGGQKVMRGRGCAECKGTGYKGHVGVFSVMPVTDELRDLVLTRPQPGALRQFCRKMEKTSMIPDGMAKAKAGLTTLREVMQLSGLVLDPDAAGI